MSVATPTSASQRPALRVALVGNPNCGKTALFNRLTGSRQKVANYAGVTVERKEGHFVSPAGRQVRVLDLPGAYSLHAASLDEAITRDICLGKRLLDAAVTMPARTAAMDDRLDRILLHPVFGLVILAVLLFLMFQAVFSWATPLMDGIEGGVHWFGEIVGSHLPEGMLRSLLVDGLIAGLGAVVVFLPQILILFL